MGVHGVVSGVGGVAGKLAGIQEFGEVLGHALRYATGNEGGRNILFVLVCHIHGQLVSHKANEGAVQLFIEGRIQVLVQEVLGLGQALQGLTRGAAVAGSGDIGPSGGYLSEGQPDTYADG